MLLCLIGLLGGCASLTPPPVSAHLPPPSLPTFQRFWLDARLSIHVERYNQAAQQASGQLLWRHLEGGDQIRVLSPLGQIMAELRSGPDGVVATLANGRQFQATTLNELVAQSLGYALPLESLSDWLAGRGSARATVVRDDQQRPVALQDGLWRVSYRYAEGSVLPSSLTVDSEAGIHLRVLVNRWVMGKEAGEDANDALMP